MGGSSSRDTAKRKSKASNEFTVYIYESEYRQIQAWVVKHQDRETGGDLFGLWADDNTAVVQLVLGPGKGCIRTAASFYQDVGYLERVGNLLTNQEGLCHIGEWHSHHRLGLKVPSGGDKDTVWRNMGRYEIHRFCLFIATIGDASWSPAGSIRNDVAVNSFFFTSRYHPEVVDGKFKRVQEKSPYRTKYARDIEEGAESVNDGGHLQAFAPLRNETTTRSKKKSDLRVKYTRDIEEGAERVNVEGQAYVPVRNTTIMRGKDEYNPMMPVEDEKPKDNSERSGICCPCCRFCLTCLLVNWP